MFTSTIFKAILLVISIFCLFILEMDSYFFNTLLLVSLFTFYTYRIYCKAKFNLNLWIYFTILLLLSLSVLAISWAVIVLLLKAVNGFLPPLIVLLSLLPDSDDFVVNYLVLTEPSDSNNFNGYPSEDGNGGSTGPGGDTGPNGNPGPNDGPAVGNLSGNSQSDSDDNEHSHVNASSTPQTTGHGASSEMTDVNRLYNRNIPEPNCENHYTQVPQSGYICTHYGQMNEIPPTATENGDGALGVSCINSGRDGYEPHTIGQTGGWSCTECDTQVCNPCVQKDLNDDGAIRPVVGVWNSDPRGIVDSDDDATESDDASSSDSWVTTDDDASSTESNER